jgi:hypothetical protein
VTSRTSRAPCVCEHPVLRRDRLARPGYSLDYQQLVDAAERRDAVAEALASVRAEGLEPGEEGLALLEAIAEGRISTEKPRARTLARYRK